MSYRFTTMKAALAVTAMALAGCTTPPPPQPAAPPPMKPLEQALLEAAKQSSDAVRALAEVEATRVPPAKIENKNVPEEFKRSVSLEWSAGAVAPAVKVIADQLNYKFIETGAKPAVAITVDIHAKDKPIYLILEDIGWQVGKRADVVVNTDHRTVEVRYAPQR